MTWGLNNYCWGCTKRPECKDAEKLQDAIGAIHRAEDGSHKGSGQVIMHCANYQRPLDPTAK